MPEIVRQPPAPTVHASRMATRHYPSPVRGLVTATIAALFMTFVGALGTGSYPIWVSLPYWLVVMEVGALIGIGVSWGMLHWGRLARRPIIEGLVIAFLIAIPLSTVVTVATILMLERRNIGLADFFILAVVVFIVSCIMTAINYAMTPSTGAPLTPFDAPFPGAVNTADDAPTVAPVQPAPPAASFMQRLPLRLRHAQLLAIEAEDHYLRVHTDAGSELILMRLADAVAELDGTAGARTHRSWWVARDAVADIQTEAGRISLRLSNNLLVPVSRNNRAALLRDGWLSR